MRVILRTIFIGLIAAMPALASAQEDPKKCVAQGFAELNRAFAVRGAKTAPIQNISECNADQSLCTYILLQNRKDAAAEAEAAIRRGQAFVKQCLDKFFKEPPQRNASPGTPIEWSYADFSGDSIHLCTMSRIANEQTFFPDNPDQVQWYFTVGC